MITTYVHARNSPSSDISQNYLALKLDVTKHGDIEDAFGKVLKKFNRVDVVVNNAGYGLGGPFEELSEDLARAQMEVNFFGLIAVTRKAMSVMRDQKPSGGLIQQVTSIGGQRGVPLFSIYCASKWAVEGFTEAVVSLTCRRATSGYTNITQSKEVKPEWGIKFTCIEPGKTLLSYCYPFFVDPRPYFMTPIVQTNATSAIQTVLTFDCEQVVSGLIGRVGP